MRLGKASLKKIVIFVITIRWPWTLGIKGQLNNIKMIYPIYNKNDSTSLTDMISASMWYHVLTLILALDSYLMHIQYLCVWVQSLQFCTMMHWYCEPENMFQYLIQISWLILYYPRITHAQCGYEEEFKIPWACQIETIILYFYLDI